MPTDILPFDPTSISPSITAMPDIYQLQEPFISIPPVTYNFFPSNGDNTEEFNVKLSIIGGCAVGIDNSVLFPCANVATLNDIHNFGYSVYISELNTVLTRISKYQYTDTTSSVTAFMNTPSTGWYIQNGSYLYKNSATKPTGVYDRDSEFGLDDPDYIENLTVTYFNE